MEFRLLTKNDIELRVGKLKPDGCSMLLYKTARVDMDILDETVGAMGWQRDHKEIKGNVYCGIGIKEVETHIVVWKWDAGAESYTEAVKGEASDSFKRAGFNWGIGRELYTSPFVWIKLTAGDTKENAKGKLYLKSKFKVKDIGYNDKKEINKLIIVDQNNKVRFNMTTPADRTKGKDVEEVTGELATASQIAEIQSLVSDHFPNQDAALLKTVKCTSYDTLTVKKYEKIKKTIQATVDRNNKESK